MHDLATDLATLPAAERAALARVWADRAVRLHLPLVLRAVGLHEHASALEDLPPLTDDGTTHAAAAVLLACSETAPAGLLTDGLLACLAAASGAPDAALRAAQAAQSASSRHETTHVAVRVSSPSGLPVGLHALSDTEASRQHDEVRAHIGEDR